MTVIGPAGTAPFTRTYAQRTRIAEHAVAPVSVRTLPTGSVVVDFGAVYAARPRVTFRSGQAGRTVPMHVGYLLDPDGEVSTTHGTQVTNLSFSYVMADGPQTFEAFSYLGFRYLQIDDPGEAIGAGPGGRARPPRRHARGPDGDLRHRRPRARRRLEAQRALVPVLLPRAVRRHPDTGEGAVPLGRGQRVRGGDARPTASRT